MAAAYLSDYWLNFVLGTLRIITLFLPSFVQLYYCRLAGSVFRRSAVGTVCLQRVHLEQVVSESKWVVAVLSCLTTGLLDHCLGAERREDVDLGCGPYYFDNEQCQSFYESVDHS